MKSMNIPLELLMHIGIFSPEELKHSLLESEKPIFHVVASNFHVDRKAETLPLNAVLTTKSITHFKLI